MKKIDTAIILAGGRSMRMGFDKQELELRRGALFIEKSIRQLSQEFSEIIISTNNPAPLAALQRQYGFKMVADELKNRGPLSGIHAGLRASISDYSFVVAVDMPNIDLDHIRAMKKRLQENKGYAGLVHINQKTNQLEPFFAFYHASLADEIAKMDDWSSFSIRELIDRHPFYILEYPNRESGDKDIFHNINDRKDLRAYQETINPEIKKWSDLSYQAEDPVLKKMTVQSIKGSHRQNLEDEVAVECRLEAIINKKPYAILYCSPKDLKALLVGYLFFKGIIEKPEDILNFQLTHHSSDFSELTAELILKEDIEHPRLQESPKKTLFQAERAEASFNRENSISIIYLKELRDIAADFEHGPALFARTGASHACCLIQNGAILDFKEDIDLHHALHKLIGEALLVGTDLRHCFVLLSGRMTSEILRGIIKTPMAGVLSRSGPTDRSIELAKQHCLTMIGFLNGERMKVYHLPKGHQLME